jgi:DNA-binding PadR family transcriptional regulator
MLDLAILGLLQERDLHGYEIRKRMRDQLGLLANVSYGSIYPALRRLERSGAVEVVEVGSGPAPTVPPTGSLSGELAVLRSRRPPARGRRSRKVYRSTAEGARLFGELLAGGSPDDAQGFGLRVAFARYLPPAARVSLLERRRAVLVDRLRSIREAAGDPALDVYARAVVEHTADGVAQDIAWLDRLLEAERAGPERTLARQ